MIVGNFDLADSFDTPRKADTKLIVDSNAALTPSVAREFL
jgi:hypothetical protein